MKLAAIIPARKGSKRIKNKNRIEIDGELLIYKVIKNLREFINQEDIFLTTDDQFLINQFSKEVTLLDREDKFTDDYSTLIDLVNWHQKNHLEEYDFIFLVLPHAVCTKSSNYIEALSKFKNSKKTRMMTVSRLQSPVEWTYKIENGELIENFPGRLLKRSQDLGQSYVNVGQFYLYKKDWFKKKDLSDLDWYEMDILQSIDLDEPEDIERLKLCYKLYKSVNPDLA